MKHEEIIAMANEAGLNSYRIAPSQAVEVWTRFAALVAAKECEAIAAHYAAQPHAEFFGAELADDIRARGQKEGA